MAFLHPTLNLPKTIYDNTVRIIIASIIYYYYYENYVQSNLKNNILCGLAY
jgi:hypothetical protein